MHCLASSTLPRKKNGILYTNVQKKTSPLSSDYASYSIVSTVYQVYKGKNGTPQGNIKPPKDAKLPERPTTTNFSLFFSSFFVCHHHYGSLAVPKNLRPGFFGLEH